MGQQTFIQRLFEHIQSHYNLDNEELTIVFPNKRAAFYLRSEFQKQCQKTIWLPQMLSIQEAVTQWSKMTLVDNIDLLFELIDIDAETHKEQTSDLSVFGSQAAQMAKDFDEIDQYDIDAFHLFNDVKASKEMDIWNFDESKRKEKEQKYLQFFMSLYGYYQSLRERLITQGKGYYGMITRHLASLPDETLVAQTQGRKIIFAGFNALTTTEERIIDKLVKNGCAEVIFDYDSHYVDNPDNEAGRFARRYRDTHPDWMKEGISDHLSTDKKTIHIVSANGNTLQTKALQERLQANQETDTAIILADETLLIPLLNAIPNLDCYEELKVSMGYPINKTPVNQLIKSYFSLQRRDRISRKVTQQGIERDVEGWYIWPVMQLMDLEIVKIIFSSAELAQFYTWKKERLTKGKFIFEDTDINECTNVADLQQFMRLLLSAAPSRCNDLPKATIENLKQLIRFIANKIQKKKDEKGSVFLLNQVSEIGKALNRLSLVIERHGNYIHDLQSVEILYRLLCSNSTIKLNNSSTEGLQIMGLLETRNLDFKRLHLLSVNEGILPTDKQQGSFIPHFIRKAYGLPSYDAKQAVFAYHFYRLLQNGEEIYLYFNSLGDSSGGEASRYILQIRHELKPYPNIEIKEEEFDSDASTSLEKIKLKVQKTDCFDKVRQYVFGHGFTPTSLSTYLNCSLRFYLKDILGIKEDQLDENIGTNDIGTITHEVLQRLFADYLPKDGQLQVINKELFENVIMPQCETKLEESIEHNKPYGFSDVGFNYLNRQIIRQQLKNYLNFIAKQLTHNELIVLETEGKLETYLKTPAGDCKIWGFTDHIDRLGSTYRVIDFKTGKVEKKDLTVHVRLQELTDIEYLKTIPDKALQLLIYKYLYLKEHSDIEPQNVEAEIHGLRYSNTIVFGLTKEKAKSDAAVVDCLDDDTFITDMEALLCAAITDLLDTDIPFEPTEDNNKCKNCDFQQICKR